jgi:hypothetical protein
MSIGFVFKTSILDETEAFFVVDPNPATDKASIHLKRSFIHANGIV